jgi:hypothetical protein
MPAVRALGDLLPNACRSGTESQVHALTEV